MHRILYVSFTIFESEPAQLAELIASARHRNALHGITGVLFSTGRMYMQFIEGESAPVRDLWDNIRNDEHHESVTLLAAGTARDRLFPEWSMGFFQMTPIKNRGDAGLHGDAAPVLAAILEKARAADPIAAILHQFVQANRSCFDSVALSHA